MTVASLTPAPAAPGLPRARVSRAKARSAMSLRPIRGMIVALLIVLAASAIVRADEHLQDWIPDVLEMPEDAEVVADREIGSSLRMFSISTEADVDALFADWQEALSENGYLIDQEADEGLERSIEFSGPGIGNAKIIVAPTIEGQDRSLIEFDATLQ